MRAWLVPAGLLFVVACGGSSFTTGNGSSSGTGASSGTGGSSGTGEAGGAGGGGGDVVSASSSGGAGGTGGASSATAGGGGTGGAPCVDADQDGVTDCDGDCDDSDPTTKPGAPEICGDAKDNDCQNGPDDICGGLGTFVANDGDDANPGTQAQPLKTIKQGIGNALIIGNGVDVYVAAGHYAESVTMVEGVSLFGGYKEDAAGWTRDIASNDTAILCPTFQCVLAGDAITRKTALDGFRIMGLQGAPSVAPGSVAVAVIGGSPTISHDRIFAGQVTGGAGWYAESSVGIQIAGSTALPGPLVTECEITGGASIESSWGIVFDAPAGQVGIPLGEIRKNQIHGGDAKNTAAIAAWSSAAGTTIANNDIVAGNGEASSWGIAASGTVAIDRNRINVDANQVGGCNQPVGWCGGIASYSATAVISNNIIFGVKGPTTVGVLLAEAEMAAGTVVLNANDIDGGPGNGLSTAIALRNAFKGVNTIVGSIRNNILSGGTGGKRFGLFEDDGASPGQNAQPQALQYNDFALDPNNGEIFVRYNDGLNSPADYTTMAQVNAMTNAGNNFSANPLLDGTFHLQDGSPCIDAGTPIEAPPKDMDGDPRPQGANVDVGADEHL